MPINDEKPDNTMILADNLVKIYKTTDIEVMALQGLDLRIDKGELMAIIGNSGSGKSTFLNMIGGLDRPSAGKLFVDGSNLFTMSDKQLINYKRSTVGFVWQNNARNLLPYLSAIENIMTPMQFVSGHGNKRSRALELLDLVGMTHRKNNRLNQLSGGEQQRIAIAIALANNPKLLLADEPTGSVDRKTSDYILDLFKKLNEERGITVVIVTHDVGLTKKVNRVASIRDGKISSEQIVRQSVAVDLSGIEGLSKKQEGRKTEDTETDDKKEYAILDRAGRVQIPRELLDEMGLAGNQVKMSMTGGKIIIEKPE